jgi:hypothetical protein
MDTSVGAAVANEGGEGAGLGWRMAAAAAEEEKR